MNTNNIMSMTSVLILLLVSSFRFAHAQWTDTGPSMYTLDNIGIGTMTPSGLLDVQGGISRFGSLANYGRFDAGGNLRFFGAARYVVLGNTHAFKAPTNSVGLYFNSTNSRLEFTDGASARMFSVDVTGPTAGDGFFNGNLTVVSTVTAASFVGDGSGLTGLSAGSMISDGDGDTKVQVEELRDEDVIRFDVAGTERWVMIASRLESKNTGGSVMIGENAGLNDDLTNKNTFVGGSAGFSNTTGDNNSFFGEEAGYSNTTGENNTFVGQYAGGFTTSGSSNSFFGRAAGFGNTIGADNSFFGNDAGLSNLSGSWNSFFGQEAGFGNTTGSFNSFFGHTAGYSNTTGEYNSFFGEGAGAGTTTGNSNSFFGKSAGYTNMIGYNNSFFGREAGYFNTIGFYNSFFGEGAGYSNASGIANSFFGQQAGYSTTGSSNSFFGRFAGHSNTTGNFRTAVGESANSTGTAYDNSTGLGYDADCTAGNQVRIGNSSVTSIGGYANWSNISDSRFKKNVQEDIKGLEFIRALRPVSYTIDLHAIDGFMAEHYGEESADWQGKFEKESVRYSGFIAQEVEYAAKSVGYDFSGVDVPKNQDDYYGLRYAEFVVPLVKAVQEQQEVINRLLAALEANGINVDVTPQGKEKGKDLGSEIIQKPGNTAILGALPADYNLSYNYPNPFNPSTTVEYALPEASHVTIKVYNTLGQEVRTLVDEHQPAGYKSVVWDGKNNVGSPVSSGTYIYKMTSGDFVKTLKVVLTK